VDKTCQVLNLDNLRPCDLPKNDLQLVNGSLEEATYTVEVLCSNRDVNWDPGHRNQCTTFQS